MWTMEQLHAELSGDATGRRFLAKIKLGPVPDGHPELGPCILWTAAIDKNTGYARFKGDQGRTALAHTWLYKRLIGPVEPGLQLDHICHDKRLCAGGPSCPHRSCVIHLMPVTPAVNWLRSNAPSLALAEKTHCDGYEGKYHHEFTPENTYITPEGYRSCRKCRYLRQRDHLRNKKAALAATRRRAMEAAGQQAFDFT